MSEGESRLAPIDVEQLAAAVSELQALRLLPELRAKDLLVILSRGSARPWETEWIRNPSEVCLYEVSRVEVYECPGGPLGVWLLTDGADSTPWTKWWEKLAFAGLAFHKEAEEGRRLIVEELVRLRGADTDSPLIRVESATLAVNEILNKAMPPHVQIPAAEAEQGAIRQPLSDLERNILQAMLEEGATENYPKSQHEIAMKAIAEDKDISSAIKTLKEKSLVATKRGLGTYLTEAGTERAKELTDR